MKQTRSVRAGVVAVTIALLAAFQPTGGPSAAAPAEQIPPTWRLTFDDEFDSGALDTSVWTPHRGLEPYTYGNPYGPDQDDSAFDPSRVSVQDGALRLSWDKTPARPAGSWRTYPYTAGVAHTGKAVTMRHGYVEARVRFTDTPGLWPAFWLLPAPVDQSWPPEIDVAEWVTDDTPDGLYKPHWNYHWQDGWGTHRQAYWKAYGREGVSYAGEWHTYGLHRGPGRMDIVLDGQIVASYEGPQVTDAPMYIVFSTGVRRGADPGPGAMEVDYLRLWEPPDQAR